METDNVEIEPLTTGDSGFLETQPVIVEPVLSSPFGERSYYLRAIPADVMCYEGKDLIRFRVKNMGSTVIPGVRLGLRLHFKPGLFFHQTIVTPVTTDKPLELKPGQAGNIFFLAEGIYDPRKKSYHPILRIDVIGFALPGNVSAQQATYIETENLFLKKKGGKWVYGGTLRRTARSHFELQKLGFYPMP